MKPNHDESIESWSERVRMFEHGRAMMQVAQGKNIDQVLEEMARRIMEKMLHPIYKAMSNIESTYDAEAAKQSYKEKFLNIVPKASDHIDDTLT
jgi:glutamyl-tRNA reductase